jgi:plastocyanin
VTPAAESGNRIARLLALGTTLAVVPGVAACGGDGGDSGKSSPTEPKVSLVDIAIEPASATIRQGETMTFSNEGEQIHNVRGVGFFSDGLAGGERYSHRFAKPGRYPYLCTLHPTTMRGVITVKPR